MFPIINSVKINFERRCNSKGNFILRFLYNILESLQALNAHVVSSNGIQNRENL